MSSLVQSVDWLAIAPPTIAAVVGLVVLVADLFVSEARKPLLGLLPVAGLAAATLMLLPLLDADRSTFCLAGDAGACSYTADRFTLVIQFLVLGGALLAALLSVTVLKDEGKRLPEGEYWFLFLSSAAGAALLPASRDLATLVVALEVASLPAFALVGLRHGDRKSSEAALKFFLSSVTATAVSLLGISFVYAATGTLHLTLVAERVQHVDGQLHTLTQTGVVLTLVGFAFKTAAVPFHFWVPDTYVGAPLPVAAYLSVIGKAVGFSGIVLVTVVALPSYADVWGPALAALAALTMTVGNVGALRQQATRAHSAVRLLAWSSVGQAGYLLVPIAAAAYSDDAERSIGSTVAYALMYGAVNLGAFAVAALVGRAHRLNRVADYRGPLRLQPSHRAPPGLLPALPRRAPAGRHRPLRQGHRLLRGRRRRTGLARRRHGRQRRHRAGLLPPVDGPAVPRPRGRTGEAPAPRPPHRRPRPDRRPRRRPVRRPPAGPALHRHRALLTTGPRPARAWRHPTPTRAVQERPGRVVTRTVDTRHRAHKGTSALRLALTGTGGSTGRDTTGPVDSAGQKEDQQARVPLSHDLEGVPCTAGTTGSGQRSSSGDCPHSSS
ncbi:hypothetical protein GCM10023238_21890 [Streptomyces heliomycini]